ncbi:MAG: cytochrome b [Gammaproteobacteria bacterium]
MATNSIQAKPSAGETMRYGSVAIALHWVMFLLVVWVGILGLMHDTWPKRTQAYWINIHAMSGLILWILLISRIVWRIKTPPPHLPTNVGEWSRRLSRPVHLALYGLIFIIPLIGIVTFIWHGRVFDFGLFQINPGVASNRAVFHPTETVHGYLAYALFALVGIHALAALWHGFVRHDDVLRRMWPKRPE